jgi:Ca2+/Na+ antiporter
MKARRIVGLVHLAGTVWFMLCTVCVFVLAMWQAGFNLLVIFSLSGYLAVLVTLLVCLYLFIIFRGTDKAIDMQQEHPFTSTTYYMAFYASVPFLGAIAGALGMIGEPRIRVYLEAIALGTIGATFLTWIVVDCIAGSVELFLPQPRSHRARRLAEAKLKKQQEQENRKQLLTRILEQENESKRQWELALAPQARRLAGLLVNENVDWATSEREAIGIGVEAWRMGGLNCMRQLHTIVINNYSRQYNGRQFVDYISGWWDGIGSWRTPAVS